MPEPSDEWKRLNFITTCAIFMIWQRRVSVELPTPPGLPIRSGILRAETGNRTGQWEGDKDQVGGRWLPKRSVSHQSKSGLRVIAEIFPAQPDLESAPHFVYLIVIIIWIMRIIFYRTPRYVKANAIGIWLKIAHSPEPLTWGLVAANDWNVYLTVSWTRCWAAWKLFWAEAFN